MTITMPKVPVDIPALLSTLAPALNGRRALSVLAGYLLYDATPAEIQAHVHAVLVWATGGMVLAAALSILGVSMVGSIKRETDRKRGGR